ncbi:phosphoglycerate mutase-like protein [Neoconidiobolus thromboides FSU 785]|nr:phosphoglycerate mutase-like protein [Neoconidiobolus thromboides FSU 785]
MLPEGYENEPWSCALEQSHVDNLTFKPSTKYYQNSCDPNVSPFNYCSLNPYSSLFWPGNCSAGQLTPKGMAYQVKLGQNLKKIYHEKTGLIQENWLGNQKDILVRASDVWRTHQSAISLMSGMFPFNYNTQFDSAQFRNLELPIFTLPAEIEYMVPNPKNCPNIAILEKKITQSKAMKELLNFTLPDRKQFLDMVYDSNSTRKFEYNRAFDFFYFTDIFQVRKCHNKKNICSKRDPTNCVTPAMVDNTMIASNGQYRIMYRDNEAQFPLLAKLRMGPFLLEMKRKFLAHIANLEKSDKIIDFNHPAYSMMGQLKKIYYYSGHDTSVTPLLGALNSTEMRWPPYSSNIQFELWKKDSKKCKSKNSILNQYFIRMFYNGKSLVTSWCPESGCSIHKFLGYLDNDLGLIGGFEAYLPESVRNKPFNLVEECFKDVITTPNPNGTS